MTVSETNIANGDSHSYWNAAREGRLELQRCDACGHVQFPPRVQCAKCWSEAVEAFDASGKGTIESFTIVRRAPLPAFRGKVPYVIVAVTTQEGPRIIANLVGDNALDAAIGDPVEVLFEADTNGDVLPQFRLA